MSDETTTPPAKPVPVKSLKYHTLDGKEHDEGDRYLAPADQVDSLVAQGMVEVIDVPEGGAGKPPHATQLPAEGRREAAAHPDPKRRG